MNNTARIIVLPIRASSRATDLLTAIVAAYVLHAVAVVDYDYRLPHYEVSREEMTTHVHLAPL